MRNAGLRMLVLLLLPLLLCFPGRGEAAGTGGKIFLDAKELTLPKNTSVQNVNGSVMVPIRLISENLGYTVNWEPKTRKVTLKQDFKTVELTVGSKEADADGVQLKLNAAPIQSKGDSVMVPIRFISEQFGLKVDWNNTDKIVYLSGGVPAVPTSEPSPTPGASAPAPAPSATPAPSQTPGQPASQTPSGTLQSVKGAVFSENKLLIAVSGPVQPVVQKLDSPTRIVVDLPYTNFAPDAAVQGVGAVGAQAKLDTAGYPQVKEVRYALFSSEPSTVRYVIELVGDSGYAVYTDEMSGLITIDLNHTTVPSPAPTPANGGTPTATAPAASGAPVPTQNPAADGKLVVVLDAGHGGKQPGASSVTGKKEKDFNLAVILKVKQLLDAETGIQAVYTRVDDKTLGLQDRVDIAEKAGADIFISVHANSWTASTNGTETYYTRKESLELAKVMHKHLVAATGLKDNGVRTKSLHVTRETSMPAVLLEVGYLSNKKEEAILYSEKLQNDVAREIVAGIKEYLGL